MGHTRIPGIKGSHQIITPTCRANRGREGAFVEAVQRIFQEYRACQNEVNRGARFHLVMTVEREED